MIRRVRDAALAALLLGCALLSSTAWASLPSVNDVARSAAEPPLASEIERELPEPCTGPFSAESLPPKSRVMGFELDLHCQLGGDGGLSCAPRRVWSERYDGTTSDRLVYAKARYFDPEFGRFTSQDDYLGKLDNPPSLHRYFYANDNPTRYLDPTGHVVEEALGYLGQALAGLDTSVATPLGGGFDQTANFVLAGAKTVASESLQLPLRFKQSISRPLTPGIPELVGGPPGEMGFYRERQVQTMMAAANPKASLLEAVALGVSAVPMQAAVVVEEAVVQPAIAIPGKYGTAAEHLGQMATARGIGDKAAHGLEALKESAEATATVLGLIAGGRGVLQSATEASAARTIGARATLPVGQPLAAPSTGPQPLRVLSPHFTPGALRVLQNMTNAQNATLGSNPAVAQES